MDALFFFFFPPPLKALADTGSCEAEANGPLGNFEVGVACEAGAGVVEERPALADIGVSGTLLSEAVVGSVNDWLACIAVVRMAFIKSMVFCLFFPPVEVSCIFFFAGISVNNVSDDCVAGGSSSDSRFLPSSAVAASLIGHTNPVRGVYAGRCCRSISSEFCSECIDVSRRLDTKVYTSGD